MEPKLELIARPIAEVEDSMLLVPSGLIRAATAEQFREHVDELLGEDLVSLVIDFSGVEYIDSSTAGYLLNVHDRLKEKGGALALADLTTGVQVVVDSIGLTTFFTVSATVQEAIEELAGL